MSASTGSAGVSIIYKDIQDPRVKEYFKKIHDEEKGNVKDPEGVLTAKGMGISDEKFNDLAIKYVFPSMDAIKFQDGHSAASVSVVDGKLVIASHNVNHLAGMDFQSFVAIIDKEGKSRAWVVETQKPLQESTLATVEKYLVRNETKVFSEDPSLSDVSDAKCVWKSPDNKISNSSQTEPDLEEIKGFSGGTIDLLIVHGTNEQKIILGRLRKQVNEALSPKDEK